MWLERNREWLIPVLLATGVALLYLGAPAGGSFSWSDAPRHALNGVFVKDLFSAAPFSDPAGFAYSYYAQYPALTILLYPPLLYFISAPFYALFGVSESTALLVVGLHYIAFACGSWKLFRFWLPPWQAAAAAAMLAIAPEIAFWGRQVMLEIPAFAFMVWSAVFFTRYRRELRPLFLYVAAFLLVLAMYTKLTACFLAPVYAATLIGERKTLAIRDRHTWIVLLLSIVSLIPLFFITVKFGQANVQSVTGIADAVASRKTFAGWIWYAQQFPAQLGWPLVAVCLLAAMAAALKKTMGGMSRQDFLFWLFWLIAGYLFFSAVDLKEARHSVFLLPPLVLASALFLARLPVPWFSAIALALLTLAVVIETVMFRPVFYVRGYAEAAEFIAKAAPQDSKILFSGYRDGSFVFNMRGREDRRDLSVIRADKLLLSVAVRRELGVGQKDLSEIEISDLINQLGVQYVVAQPGFWNDLEIMQRFERVLASSQFKEVARISTPANYNAHEKELVIYRNEGPVNKGPVRLQLDLPIIGRTIKAEQ